MAWSNTMVSDIDLLKVQLSHKGSSWAALAATCDVYLQILLTAVYRCSSRPVKCSTKPPQAGMVRTPLPHVSTLEQP